MNAPRTTHNHREKDYGHSFRRRTTCVAHIQRQHLISIRPAEAQYSNTTAPVPGQYSSGIRPAEAQYSNAATPVQGQYSSGTPHTQNFWMNLLHNDRLYFALDSIY